MPARLTSKSSSPRAKPVEIAHRLRRSHGFVDLRFKQGCDHYCAMRTKCEHRVNGKLHGSEPVADFVQRFMRPTEPLKLRRGCSRGTSHSASRREFVSMSYRDQAISPWRTRQPLLAFSGAPGIGVRDLPFACLTSAK